DRGCITIPLEQVGRGLGQSALPRKPGHSFLPIDFSSWFGSVFHVRAPPGGQMRQSRKERKNLSGGLNTSVVLAMGAGGRDMAPLIYPLLDLLTTAAEGRYWGTAHYCRRK